MLGILLSCNNKKTINISEKEFEPYIISVKDSLFDKELKKDSVKAPYIPAGLSGECNLIIDKNGAFYYYQTSSFTGGCGTGMENDTIPKFLDLQTEDLIKIPKESLEKFVEENVMKKPQNRKILIMASQKDTIIQKSFLKFLRTMKVPTYIIRRTTQEEDTVLHYKRTDRHYFSEEIKWDKTKIKLRN